MPAVRVIPPHEPRGLYAATAALALILGPLAGLAVLRSTIPIPSSSPWNELTTVFLIPAIFITIFATRCQRRRPVFLTALLFGFCFWLSFIVAQDLAQPTSGGAQMLSGAWVGLLLAASIIAIITALAALALRWIIRCLLVLYIEQTGRLCPRCAYPVDVAAQPICPECGGPTAPPRPRRQFATAAHRAGRPSLIATLVILATAAAFVFARRGYPIHRFQSRLSPHQSTQPAGFIITTGPDGKTIQRTTPGAWIPFGSSPSRGVIAAYLVDDEPGLPAMQLRLTDRIAPRSFAAVSPEVRCSLNRSQAEWVIKHGVPKPLLDAVEAAAAGPAGNPDFIRRTEIDPAPYFPK